MEKVQFDEICSKLNIDEVIKAEAIQQYQEITKNTILDGAQENWFACALFSTCNKTSVPSVGNAVVHGQGLSLSKLIQVCNLTIFTFFEKIETWFKVSSVPNVMHQKVENLKRSFHVSQLIYKEFSNMFAKLFVSKDVGDEPKSLKNRKKNRIFPYTSQKLFEACWSLFVCAKGEYPDKATDLVTSINLLMCCLDLIFTNVVRDKRRDLINPSFPALPKGFFSASWDESRVEHIKVIEKLCENRQTVEEVMKVKHTRWDAVIKRLFNDQHFEGDSESIISVENFEENFKKMNDLYEAFILTCGQFDERVFLAHPEFGSKTFGRSLIVGQTTSMGMSQDGGGQMSSSLMPQTPLSGQDFSLQSSTKLSPISSYKQNVQKLKALHTGQRGPTNSLKEIILLSCPQSTIDHLQDRLEMMQEIFCSKMIANGQDRFQYAEALYYRLLESIIKAEMKTHGRFNLFIDDDVFNQALIVLCLEIVLFAFSLHKELTALLDCFHLEPFHFYKLIEVAIRNNKDYFTNDIIKHLKAIEEQCLDSLAWTSGSVLWEKINEHQGKLPTNQEVDLPNSQNGSQNESPSQGGIQPKSLRLFFRKFYQLAHLRLKDLCKSLQFSNNSDLLQKIWTLFEYAVIEHTALMRDRHLDQILMCCVYVLVKIRPDENNHTFADIMKFYRNQPQADSHIYRSVFIEYVQQGSEGTDRDYGRNRGHALEPEVVSGRNTIYGTESRGDIIYFYNKVFVPKMQQFAMHFSTNSSKSNLLLSPLPNPRPLISPRKISPFHDVYVAPLTKESIMSPSARTLTFTIEQSPSKDLQKINSLINQSKRVPKRFNIDCETDFPQNKVAKDSSLQLLISDREEYTN